MVREYDPDYDDRFHDAYDGDDDSDTIASLEERISKLEAELEELRPDYHDVCEYAGPGQRYWRKSVQALTREELVDLAEELVKAMWGPKRDSEGNLTRDWSNVPYPVPPECLQQVLMRYELQVRDSYITPILPSRKV